MSARELSRPRGIGPVPKNIDANLHAWLERVQRTISEGIGESGKGGGQFVRYEDLQQAGIGTFRRLASGSVILQQYSESNQTVKSPPVLSDLNAQGAIKNVILDWEGVDYGYHSHTEIFRAEVDDLGAAVLVGTSPSNVYADPTVVAGTVYYYWVRAVAVNPAAPKGSFNATAGTPANVFNDPAEIVPLLLGQITESELAADLNTRIDLVDAPTTGLVDRVTVVETENSAQASSISTLTSTVNGHSSSISTINSSVDGIEAKNIVKIDNNGHISGYGLMSTQDEYSGAVHSEFIVSADRFAVAKPGASNFDFLVEGGKVVMDGASIKNASIASAAIASLAADKIATVDLAAISADLGEVTAGIFRNGKSSYGDNTAGYWLGVDGSTPRMHIGNSSNYLKWTGSSMIVRGNVEATAIKAGSVNVVDSLMIESGAVTIPEGNHVVGPVSMPTGTHGTIVTLPSVTAQNTEAFFLVSLTVDSDNVDGEAINIGIHDGSGWVHTRGFRVDHGDRQSMYSFSYSFSPGSGPKTYSLRLHGQYSGSLIYNAGLFYAELRT